MARPPVHPFREDLDGGAAVEALREDSKELRYSGIGRFPALASRPAGGRARSSGARGEMRPEVFWLHGASFALYDVLIGYLLLHREESGLWSLLIYFVAMALHFLTNDFGLRQDQEARYDHIGRWVIAGAVCLGWALGAVAEIPTVAIGFLFAFLAGGVVLNVLKEELPEQRQSRFWPFALGVAGYGALLLAEG